MTGNTWHVCRGGCGWLVGLLRDGLGQYRPGSVAHQKPEADINVRPVACALYQRLDAEELWALHERDPVVAGPVWFAEADGTPVGPWGQA